MAQFVKVRGLARRGFRVNNKSVTSGKTVVFDLDDGLTRRELGHHMSIGQLAIVDGTDIAVSRTGAEVTPGTTTTVSVAAGTLRTDTGVPLAGAGSLTITATANIVVAAANATNPRIDLVSVPRAGGTPVVTSGTAAASPVPPALPATSVPLATVLVPANATASTQYTITDVAPRL